MIIEIVNQEPLLVVRFNGLLGHSDEIIVKSSGRLAKLGTYTGRSDIPKYEKSDQCLPRVTNMMPSYIDAENNQNTLRENSELPRAEILSGSEAFPISASQHA